MDKNDPEVLRRRREGLWVVTERPEDHQHDVIRWYKDAFPDSVPYCSYSTYDSKSGVRCYWLAASESEAALMRLFWG